MSDLFSLNINISSLKTFITMRLFTDFVNTSEIPATFAILERNLPSILKAKCYNYENLPFFKEVRQTEIGHLYEHILLEYLCKHKISKGVSSAEFSGVTNWNWKKDPRGTFHIKINAGFSLKDIIIPSLEKSTFLIKQIISTAPSLKVSQPLPLINFFPPPGIIQSSSLSIPPMPAHGMKIE